MVKIASVSGAELQNPLGSLYDVPLDPLVVRGFICHPCLELMNYGYLCNPRFHPIYVYEPSLPKTKHLENFPISVPQSYASGHNIVTYTTKKPELCHYTKSKVRVISTIPTTILRCR